uniref:Ig-like domain-containing protein n=1 Tax=Methylibium sp. TaxID=2067992 RepID=UPI0017F19BE8
PPPAGAVDVGTATAVTVTFSEALDASTLTTSTFELRDGSNALMPGVARYRASNRWVVLNPMPTPAALANYTVPIRGGTSDPRAKDVAGNALAVNRVWSPTTW